MRKTSGLNPKSKNIGILSMTNFFRVGRCDYLQGRIFYFYIKRMLNIRYIALRTLDRFIDVCTEGHMGVEPDLGKKMSISVSTEWYKFINFVDG
jgi:hypothetical protein